MYAPVRTWAVWQLPRWYQRLGACRLGHADWFLNFVGRRDHVPEQVWTDARTARLRVFARRFSHLS